MGNNKPVEAARASAISHNRALTVICFAAFMVPFMGSSLNLAIPQISESFGMRAVTLTWIATGYLISTTIFQIPFARVADLVGRRKVFTCGVAVFTLSTLMCGFATSGGMLIALRFCSGIGSAMLFGTNMAIITAIFPPEKRAKALGVNTAVVYAAQASGPFFGGLLTHYLGWHSIFFASAGVGLLVLLFTLLFLRGEWVEARGERFDLTGTLLYGCSLAGIIYGFANLPSAAGFAFLGGGIGALIMFIWFERRQRYPVFDIHLFTGNRIFAFSSLAALINYASTMGITFMLSLYLQYIREFDARHAGMILICQALTQMVFSLASGGLSSRFQPALLATAGMGVICTGLVILLFISATTPIWTIVLILVLFGIGFGIFASPNTNVIMSSVDKKHYSQASAITGTMRLTGQSFSMGIAGMAISFTLGNEKIIPDLHPHFIHGMRIAFSVFLILCLTGIYFSSIRLKKNKF